MLVVVIDVVAQNMNKYGNVPSVCMCFLEDPLGVIVMVIVFGKIYIPSRGELRGYYGIRIAGP